MTNLNIECLLKLSHIYTIVTIVTINNKKGHVHAIWCCDLKVVCRSLATMSMNDYDADATELLETYGMFLLDLFSLELTRHRFSHEIHNHWCDLSTLLSPWIQSIVLGEAGTGKSCLLHHFTHNSCRTRK